MPAPRTAVLLVFALGGCAGQRAHRAYEGQRYDDAIELYESALRRRPHNERLAMRLDEARDAYVRAELDAMVSDREGGRHGAATVRLEALLARGAGWRLDAKVDGAIGRQVAVSADHDHARVRAVLDEYGPLTAERELPHAKSLMHRDAYRTVRNETLALLRRRGAERCEIVGAEVTEQPYLAWLLSFYCDYYQAPVAVSVPRPDACNEITLEGTLRGASAAEDDALREAVAAAYQVSALYDPRARCRHHAVVSGERTDDYAVTTVHKGVQWAERVPYQTTETVQVPHQVPYTDVEYYSVQEPYTTTESYTYSCGYNPPRSCTGTRSKTNYRTVTKSRTVTKYRTEYRPETRTVTKYRSVIRQFEYDAQRHHYAYEARGRLQVDAAYGLRVDSEWTHEQAFTGIQHDVSLPAARLWPEQADLPDRAAVFGAELDTFSARLRAEMAHAYERRHCEGETFDADRAAACVLARPARYPTAAADSLEAAMGERVEALQGLLPSNPFATTR